MITQEIDDFIYPDAGLVQQAFYLIADDKADEALRLWTENNETGELPDSDLILGIILSKIPAEVERAREVLWACYDGDDASFKKSLHWMEFVGAHCNEDDARIFLSRKIEEWGAGSVKSLTLESCCNLFAEDISEYLRLTRLLLKKELHAEDSQWIYQHACEVISGYKLYEDNEDIIKDALYLFPTNTPFVVTWLYLLMAKKDYARLAELAKTEVNSALPGDLCFSLAAVLMEQEQYQLAETYLRKIQDDELTDPSKVNLFLLCSRSLQQLNVYKKVRTDTELEKLRRNLSEWNIWIDIHSSDDEFRTLSVTHRDLVSNIARQLEISI